MRDGRRKADGKTASCKATVSVSADDDAEENSLHALLSWHRLDMCLRSCKEFLVQRR